MALAQKHAFPSSPRELTSEWLTVELRKTGGLGADVSVCGFDTEPVGVGVGLLGELVRVNLDYSAQAPGQPASLVAKFPSATPENRAVAMHHKLYEREVRFYREVAGEIGEIAARCYAAEIDPASGDSVILLEDLGAYRQGDQEAGCTASQAELIADAIAPLHARYWGRARDGLLPWAMSIDNENQIQGITAGCVAGWDHCTDLFGAVIAPEILAKKDVFLAAVPELHRRMARRPQTYVHGDLRLDNLMFGQAPGQRPLVALDWAVFASTPMQDLAYALSQNVTIPERRLHERRIIERHRQRLMQLGVSGYSTEQAFEDYRAAILYLYAFAVVIGGTLAAGNDRGGRMMAALLERSSTAVMDLGLLETLPA